MLGQPDWVSCHNVEAEAELERQFDVVIERDEEGYYVASVPQIPGRHTQAKSLDEVMERIREAILLCLEVAGTASAGLSDPTRLRVYQS